MDGTIWSTVRAFLYAAVFGLAAYAVIVNDRDLIKMLTPVVAVIVGWWIWQDLRVMLDRRRREREGRSAIIEDRLDRLEDRLADLENRVDGL
jgi:hypothetical protein